MLYLFLEQPQLHLQQKSVEKALLIGDGAAAQNWPEQQLL